MLQSETRKGVRRVVGSKSRAVDARYKRERAIRREAMEPLKRAMKQHRPPMTQMWLKQELDTQGYRVGKTTLNNWINGYCRVPREVVRMMSGIVGANIGDVYARIAGREEVLFQPDKR